MRKKVVSFILVVFMIMKGIFPIVSFASNEKSIISEEEKPVSTVSDLNKDSFKDKEENEDSSNYTEEYKRWLELSEEERANCNIIPRKYKIPFSVLYDEEEFVKNDYNKKLRKSLNVRATQEQQLPKDFDLRSKIEIPVRNQGTHGLCWAFASLKSLETYLSLNGYGNFDFSENHLAYLNNPEWLEREKNNIESWSMGEFEKYTRYRLGPVFENEVPYDVEYSQKEIEDLLAINPKAYVGNIIEFPGINKRYNEYSQEELDLFRKKVKQHIEKNGGLYCAIYADDIKRYNNNYVLNYQGNNIRNHAVCIIGWDDNFSKDNFPEECRPKNDGAYIAINSWGEDWGKNGVFYISYEDYDVEGELWGIGNASTNIENTIDVFKFEDINLYKAIKEILGRTVYDYNDETLTIYTSKLAIKSLNKLNLDNKNISNLKGLEYFKDVRQLYLSNNNIEDIGILKEFKNLSRIDLSNNNIENIEALDINLYDDTPEVNLENNNIKDITPLKNYYKINISGNPIESGINSLNKVAILNIGNCILSNEQLNQISELPLLYELGLQNDNIKDVSFLENANTIEELDLSNNKELTNINRLINIHILNLSDCGLNDDIIEDLKQLYNLNSLNLSKNNISDTEQLGNIWGISTLDLSYTNIIDVSYLGSKQELVLSGNHNLINLDKLYSVRYLTLDDCQIKDFSFIDELSNLYSLSLRNNNIKSLPEFNNDRITSLDLKGNEIMDISNLKEYINKFRYPPYIDLSNNQIEKIPEDLTGSPTIEFENNKIAERPDNKYHRCNNQKIVKECALELNSENRISLPQIFNLSLNYCLSYYTDFETENCIIDRKKGEIIINPKELGEGHASVTIKNDQDTNNGTSFIVNYEVKSNIEYAKLELGENKYKDVYIEGEEFDNANLQVKYVTDEGVFKIVTDYEIINGKNLQQNQQNVIIKYNNIELEIPIKVFQKDSYDLEFSKGLYDYLDGVIGSYILYYEEHNNDKVRCIIVKEAIDTLERLDVNSSAFDGWQSEFDFFGLSQLCNLKELKIANNIFAKQEDFFAEVCKLHNLENLILENCIYNASYYPKEECIKEVLKLPKLQLIDLGEQKFSSGGYIEKRDFELPKYLTTEDIKGISVKVTYKNSNDEDITEDLPIYVDENNKLYVIQDTEVTDNKKYGTRRINVDISTKIKQKINYKYDWELDTDKPSAEITGDNLMKIEGTQQLTTKSNSVLYTFKWSENVYGFTKDSILVENGDKGDFTEVTPNRVYTLVVNNEVNVNQEFVQKVLVDNDICTDLGSNGNIENSMQVIIDKKAPIIQINGDTLEGEEISIKFEDLSKITGWQITDKENEPTEWNTNIENNTIKYTVQKGTRYVWAKDYLNNISHKAIISKGISDKVEIKEYLLEDNIIKNVKQATNIADLKKNLIIKDLSYKILDKDGKELKEDDLITTGSKVEISLNNEKIIYIFSVTGDTTGDGRADIKDILLINKHRLNKAKLENEYFIAGDINKDSKVDIKDILQLNKFRLGKTNSL